MEDDTMIKNDEEEVKEKISFSDNEQEYSEEDKPDKQDDDLEEHVKDGSDKSEENREDQQGEN